MCWLVILGAWMGWIETVYGKPCASILDRRDDQGDDAPLPEPPDFFRAEPAVLEAQLIIRGRSISRPITDGRVVR